MVEGKIVRRKKEKKARGLTGRLLAPSLCLCLCLLCVVRGRMALLDRSVRRRPCHAM